MSVRERDLPVDEMLLQWSSWIVQQRELDRLASVADHKMGGQRKKDRKYFFDFFR